MAWAPGWNSIDTTKTIHDVCELGGILLFFIVVGLELGAYYYGHRHDFLLDKAARTTLAGQQRAQREVENRHSKELAAVQRQLEQAQDAAKEAKAQAAIANESTAPRHLTGEQQRLLVAALRGAKIRPIVVAGFGDFEVQQYANEFANALRGAHLLSDFVSSERQGESPGISVYLPNLSGSDPMNDPLCVALKAMNISVGVAQAGNQPYMIPPTPGYPRSGFTAAADARVIIVAQKAPAPPPPHD
jgi:hypothetical protein